MNKNAILQQHNSSSLIHQAKGAEFRTRQLFYSEKAKIIRNYIVNTPWILYLIVYGLLVLADSFLMYPILEILVKTGLKLESSSSMYLFMSMYLFLLVGLTIASGKALVKIIDPAVRDIQVRMAMAAQPDLAYTIIEHRVLKTEKIEKVTSMIFGGLLIVLLIALSLYRNYVVNSFQMIFESPGDYVNLILPVILALALIYFAAYKEIGFQYFVVQYKEAKFDKAAAEHERQAQYYSRMVADQAAVNGEKSDENASNSGATTS